MEKKHFIYVIDNVISGNNHIVNNTGVINILNRLFKENVEIDFFSDQAHARNIDMRLAAETKNKVKYNSINVIDPRGGVVKKLGLWQQKLKEDRNVISEIFERAAREKPKLIYFCTLIPFNILRFMELFKLHSDQRIIIGLHGEIEFLFRKKQPLKNRLNAQFYRNAFQKTPSNVKFNVLSPVIREKLVKAGFLHENQVIWMEHPIQPTDGIRDNQFPLTPIFSFLGVASVRKNAAEFFKLVTKFQDASLADQIRFELVGKIAPDLHPSMSGFNWVAENNISIPQNIYEQHCLKATYALSFLNGDEYLFRISGSLMDAIQYHIPLIALKHEYVNYLFEQGGDIGFLCSDMKEMEEVIYKIMNRDNAYIRRYKVQVGNISNLAKRFYDENNVRNLITNFSNIGWKDVLE